MAKKAGLPPPELTKAQMAQTRTKMIALLFSSLGIAIGCILGMVLLKLRFVPDLHAFAKMLARGGARTLGGETGAAHPPVLSQQHPAECLVDGSMLMCALTCAQF